MDNVCNRRLFSFPSKDRRAEEQGFYNSVNSGQERDGTEKIPANHVKCIMIAWLTRLLTRPAAGVALPKFTWF